MLSEKLITDLRHLTRAEKLQAVKLLVDQLSEEELLLSATQYEVWSPYDSAGAGAILEQMLREAENAHE
jgi:hypothetical protein